VAPCTGRVLGQGVARGSDDGDDAIAILRFMFISRFKKEIRNCRGGGIASLGLSAAIH